MGRFERGLAKLDEQDAANAAALEQVTGPQPYFVAEAFVLPDGRDAYRIVAPLTLDELVAMA